MFKIHILRRRPIPNGRCLARQAALAVESSRERKILLAKPTFVADRLIRVARECNVPVKRILQEIRGARTARNVLLDEEFSGMGDVAA